MTLNKNFIYIYITMQNTKLKKRTKLQKQKLKKIGVLPRFRLVCS